jgi:hypothetical protein
MALMKYKEIIALAKDKLKEVMAPVHAHEMKKKGELEVAKLDSKIIEQEHKIQELSSEYPLDYDKVLDAIDALNLLERRRDKFNEVIDQLFSDKVDEPKQA